MAWSSKDSLDALEYHLRTNRVLVVVKLRIEAMMLLWYNYYCLESFDCCTTEGLVDGGLNVFPDVRGVISIQVNNLFHQHVLVLRVLIVLLTVTCDCIEVILIGLTSDDVDCLVHACARVGIAVILGSLSQDPVV